MNTQSECEQTLLVQADFDGELDAAQAAALVRHREECAECRAVEAKLLRARTLLRAAPRYSASAELRERIGLAAGEATGRAASGSLTDERNESTARPRARGSLSPADVSTAERRTDPSVFRPSPARSAGGVPWGSAPPRRRISWGATAGWGAAAAVVLVAVVLFFMPRPSDISTQLVSNHLRAMQLDSHLIDVVSTDHHTVKPWFAGKVDFAPPVKQLDSDGYVLKGGRVDIVDARTAAVLIYQAGRHTVEVFIWPARPDEAAAFQSQQLNGFNLRHWEEGGLEIWCVSDMASEELDRFASRWRSAG